MAQLKPNFIPLIAVFALCGMMRLLVRSHIAQSLHRLLGPTPESPIEFLDFPAEVYVEIYAHLLPTVVPNKITQNVRGTCRLVCDEMTYEIEKSNVSRINRLRSFKPLNGLLLIGFKPEYHPLDRNACQSVDPHISPLVINTQDPLSVEHYFAPFCEIRSSLRILLHSVPSDIDMIYIIYQPYNTITPSFAHQFLSSICMEIGAFAA